MSYQLTDEEFYGYQRDGYVVRHRVFDAQEVLALQQGVENAALLADELAQNGHLYYLDGKRFVDVKHMTIQYEPNSNINAIRVIEPAHDLDPALNSLIDDARIVEPIQKLVGTQHIALWTNKINLKRPLEGTAFGWHQDSPYWIHDSKHVDQLPNVYLALDDADKDNGCFKIVKQSHRQGCLPGKDDGSQLGGFYTDPNSFDESLQIKFEISAGSLVFFNPHLVHGSDANHSDQPRRAFIITYQPANYPMLKSGDIRNIVS
ncbi:MAG: phytanoyl-CoA dioxygenase family protein [Pseudomonadales bacterium]|nr:phytanoyl-CoA dioxygenase family protein [Pseudomonadales bacterium]